MKILNRTSISNHLFRRLLDFILPQAPAAALARIEILDGMPNATTGGLAHKLHPTDEDPLAPSLIQLWVNTGGCCFRPKLEQHVPELPPFLVETWEEQVLLVLAHECRHVVQFWDQTREWPDRHEMEVDAERFAIKTVRAWRVRQGTQRAA